MACGLLDQRGLEIGLRNQIGLQLLAIFRTAAPSTWFAFYRDTDLLASWGGPELTPIDPWWLLWRGNREIAPDAPVWAIVQRLSSERLVLRDDVDADRFGFEPDERSFLSWWGNHPVTVEQILSYPCLPRGRLARMIEVLFLTRNLSYARPSSRPPATQPSSRPDDLRRPSHAVVEPSPCCREAPPPSQPGPVSERRGTPSTRMAAVHESVLASVDAVSESREPERRGTPSELDLAQRSEALRLSERSKKALEEGRMQEAERLAAEALKILPRNAVLKTEYAWVASHLPARRKIGDVGDLIDLLNQATESDPNFDQAYFVRGTIYEYLGLYEKALADFRMALARNRRNQAARERVTEYTRRVKESGSLEPGRGPSGLAAHAKTVFSGLWRRDA